MVSEECDLFLGRVVPNSELLKQIDAISQSTSRRITRGCKSGLCRLIPVPTIYWVGVYSTADFSLIDKLLLFKIDLLPVNTKTFAVSVIYSCSFLCLESNTLSSEFILHALIYDFLRLPFPHILHHSKDVWAHISNSICLHLVGEVHLTKFRWGTLNDWWNFCGSSPSTWRLG